MRFRLALALLAGLLCTALVWAQVQGPVVFDIKAEGDANIINVKSHGVLPVVVLCNADVDPATIVPSSLRLGPDAAPVTRCEVEDVNGDGCEDLACKWETQALGITCDDSTITLTGAFIDTTPFSSEAPITPKPCQGKGKP